MICSYFVYKRDAKCPKRDIQTHKSNKKNLKKPWQKQIERQTTVYKNNIEQ